MIWLLPFLLLGLNLTLWTAIGNLRLLSERLGLSTPRPVRRGLSSDDVAVLVPAHNEEVVIAATLASVLRLTAASNVHVVADGCTDDTEKIARSFGVNVLALQPAHGKAGGIAAAVEHFDLPGRFEAMLIVDADTELDEQYFERALPMLAESDVVAVAGFARTSWRPKELGLIGRVLVSYRTRLYALMQWVKFGQTWRWTNVTAIVPGFASMYRTKVLSTMDLNPPGLVIEDFNMTFELYQKRLGKVGFSLGAIAVTQDPDTLRDYLKQTKRWALGLWQTVRRHPPKANLFSMMLWLILIELLTSSLLFLFLPLLVIILLVPDFFAASLTLPVFDTVHAAIASYVNLPDLFYGIVLPDVALTLLVAVVERRPRLLLGAVFFLPLRVFDAGIALYTLPLAWLTKSNGRWTSPTRRSLSSEPVADTELIEQNGEAAHAIARGAKVG
jgi:cellulose synthase/poly-beta-1,6-N-acetylglucosamine synthase-like glycosyltransferase